MSPDDIFAAQMWPWPDPILKRDHSGRILFLNAAFLNIYGGRVEDWQGNVVAGWPAPQPGPVPNRFQTRVPTQQGELVYDWLEYTLADGNTLAVARDVTVLLIPTDPPPGHAAEPPVQHVPTSHTSAVASVADPLSETPSPVDVPAQPFVETAEAPPSIPVASPVNVAAQQDAGVQPVSDMPVNNAVPELSVPDVQIPDMAIPTDPIPEIAAEPNIPSHAASGTPTLDSLLDATPAAEAQPAAQEERDFERRALPVEDGSAVLGNNWRDAVIAKAVGVEASENSADEEAEGQGSASAQSPTDSESAEGGHRILLAEDNAINALLTRTLLEADGCTVDVVEDGALAVEAVRNSTYDMIFMDMRMPNMDGLEATRKIRALNTVSKSLPIVALTANAFDDDRSACFDSGMNDFMTKPVSAEELSEMVTLWTKKAAEKVAV